MRKTARITISAEGRDRGKTFVLTEMPAAQAEKWAFRALLLAAQSGAEVGNALSGMAGIAVVGIEAIMGGVRFADLEPLLDEMFSCVQAAPDPNHPEVVRKLVEDDTEEITTRAQLRAEVFALHTGFSFADALSMLKAGTSAPPL